MKSILVVDDNVASLRQIRMQLTNDYEVSLAKSGEMALQICAQKHPDLILLDAEMPGMNGYATIAQLKKDPELSHIPVIFLSGNDDSATEIQCLESGAVDYITKPVNTDVLRHRIDLHLRFASCQAQAEQKVIALSDSKVSALFKEEIPHAGE